MVKISIRPETNACAIATYRTALLHRLQFDGFNGGADGFGGDGGLNVGRSKLLVSAALHDDSQF